MRAFASIVIFLTLIAGIPAESADIKVVEAEGTALLGDDTTPAHAKAIALNNARRNALEQAVGVVVKGSSVIYNSDLISDLVVAATKGLIVGEKVLDNVCRTEGDNIYCMARIEARVKPLSTERKGNFRILRASLQRPDRKAVPKAPVFQNNDEIQVKVTVSEKSHVNMFSVDQYGNISRLYPNEYFRKNLIDGETEFVFPDDIQRAMGLKLRVHTPGKLKKAVESVLILATKEKMNLLADAAIESPTISDLMRELAELDPSTWAEKTLGYEVRE